MTYWERRAAQRELVSQQKASKYLSLMDESLRGAQQDVIRQMEAFYGRYATDNMVTMAEAKKLLTAKEMKDFKNIDLKRFRELSMSGNPHYDKMLNAISARAQISRLEAANAHIEMKMMELYGGQKGLQEYAYTGLTEIYQESYHRSLYDLVKGGAVVKIIDLTDARMEEVLSYNWSGREFSNRIWDHQSKAIDVIKKELEKGFASGRSLLKTTKAITDATGVMRSRAEALVRTEASFFNNLASHHSYRDAEIEQYEILATLDLRTSNICREQDGKKYNTKDFKPGTTAPPFHVRCRSTTIPWFDESKYMVGEQRQSMDGLVDSQTYEEWYGENVTGDKSNETKEKMIHNKPTDKKQYAEYRKVLGKEAPQSLVDFQRMKYNDKEKWGLLYGYKKALEKEDIHPFVDFHSYVKIAEEVKNKVVGLETKDGIKIVDYKTHFIDRLIGQIEAGSTAKGKRSGVSIEDAIDALLNPVEIKERKNSRQYVGKHSRVSVNHFTGNLIQTAPKSKR